MSDYLTIIRMTIEEHYKIREHIRTVGESVNDLEALFSLQKASSGWSQSSAEALAERQRRLQQTLNFLAEGLKNHFGFEERYLPPVFGEVLMQALLLEHRDIKAKLEEARSTLAGTHWEGLKQEDSLARRMLVQHLIDGICQSVEEHATKEEMILKMMERALEETKNR
jgi:hypothetical protein